MHPLQVSALMFACCQDTVVLCTVPPSILTTHSSSLDLKMALVGHVTSGVTCMWGSCDQCENCSTWNYMCVCVCITYVHDGMVIHHSTDMQLGYGVYRLSRASCVSKATTILSGAWSSGEKPEERRIYWSLGFNLQGASSCQPQYCLAAQHLYE